MREPSAPVDELAADADELAAGAADVDAADAADVDAAGAADVDAADAGDVDAADAGDVDAAGAAELDADEVGDPGELLPNCCIILSYKSIDFLTFSISSSVNDFVDIYKYKYIHLSTKLAINCSNFLYWRTIF